MKHGHGYVIREVASGYDVYYNDNQIGHDDWKVKAIDIVIDHSCERAEAAEIYAAELEAQLAGAAQVVVTLTKERDAFAARAVQLEIDNDEMQSYINEIRVVLHTEKDELTIEAVRRVINQRDEWKATAENQNAHLELARKDFMRRLSVVTHLWFNAKCERDKAIRQLGRMTEADMTSDADTGAIDIS